MQLICIIAAVFGIANAQSTAVSCPSCMNMSFKLKNLPDSVKDILNQALGPLTDATCLTDNAKKQECVAIPNTVNKCMTQTFAMKAVGMKNGPADAEMDATVVVKSCVPQDPRDADGCVNLKEMDANMKREMEAQVENIQKQWNKAEITTARRCIGNSPVAATTPKAADGGDNSGKLNNSATTVIFSFVSLISSLLLTLL